MAQSELVISVTLHCESWFKMLAESKGGQLVLNRRVVNSGSAIYFHFLAMMMPGWLIANSVALRQPGHQHLLDPA